MKNTFDNPYSLPLICFTTVELEGNSLVAIKLGENGYFVSEMNTESAEMNKLLANKLNEQLGVTSEQVRAMIHGSMFGWDTPGARPGNMEDITDEVSKSINMATLERVAKACGLAVYEWDSKKIHLHVTNSCPLNARQACLGLLQYGLTLDCVSSDTMETFMEALRNTIDSFDVSKRTCDLIDENGYYDSGAPEYHNNVMDIKDVYEALEEYLDRLKSFYFSLGGSKVFLSVPWHTEIWYTEDIIDNLDILVANGDIDDIPEAEYAKVVYEITEKLKASDVFARCKKEDVIRDEIKKYFQK